jgi:hypothetical protein
MCTHVNKCKNDKIKLKLKKREREKKRIQVQAGCQWLTPLILATWEAEIRRTIVQGQPRVNSS